MICPNCGTKTNEEICPFCGMNLGNDNMQDIQVRNTEPIISANQILNTDMNIQQPSYVNQGMGQQNTNAGQYMNMQMEAYAGRDMNMQQNPYLNQGMDMYQNTYGDMHKAKSKSKIGKKGGLIVGIIFLLAVVVIAVVLLSDNGVKKSEKIVDNFMTSMLEGDTDEMVSDIDTNCDNKVDVEYWANVFDFINMIEELVSIVWPTGTSMFEVIQDYIITSDYKIIETVKASDSTIEEMCEDLYEDKDVVDDISQAYVSEVEYSITFSVLGLEIPLEGNIYIICYKKNGEWYLGGTYN